MNFGIQQADDSPARVLVVDDDQATRAMLRYALEGYRIVEAGDGRAALETLQSSAVDAVLLDLMMPGMSGFEVLKAIRGDRNLKGLAVVMLTAKAEEHAHLDAFRRGADAYVTKPFEIEAVREVLAQVLNASAEEREKLRQEALSKAELLASLERAGL